MTAATTRTERWSLGYRPALDGLRGVAIALVMFSHFGGGIGGQAGVTLFFVLSGFLITSLLLIERRDTGQVSLAAFYVRRGRRLLPAIVVMVLVLVALGVSPWHGAGALSYVANWIIIEVGRIDPLSHTWSLSIEEQFYLLWPLAFIALARVSPARQLAILLIAAGASFAWRVILVVDGASVERVAFGSDVRAESLLIGCALAVAIVSGVRLQIPWWIAIGLLLGVVPLTGYTVIGATIGWLIVSLLSALAIAAVLDGHPLLETRPLVLLGRVSYGVYLWHFPLVYAIPESVSPWVRVPVLFVATVAIAAVSYRFVEHPFMKGRVTLVRNRAAASLKQ